jgi:drug/metabolite transporter, DME family
MEATSTTSRATGRLMIVGAALLWSTAGAAFKSFSVGGDNWRVALQIGGGRSMVAAVFLLALTGPKALKLGRTGLLTALSYAGTVLCFAVANRMTTAANSIFLQNTGLLYLLILGPWMLKERNRLRDYLAIFSLLGGMAVMLFMDNISSGQMLGNVFAILSGLAYAFTILGLRANREGNPAAPIIYGNLFAALLCLPVFFPLQIGAPRDLALIGYLGVCQLGLSYYLFTRGIRHVKALEAGILAFVEPILNPVWTFVMAGEIPAPWALVGCAIIAGTVVAHTVASAQTPAANPAPE